MKMRLSILAVLAGLGSSFSLSAAAQLVGNYNCDDEKVRPNLHMAETARLSGIVLDGSGAAIAGIQLRIQNPSNTWVLKSVPVGAHGEFDFGTVPSGEFRLVPSKIVNGKATKLPGFDPAPNANCTDAKPCVLRITLPARPTDLPFENCPPR
jgi:hypothetical protein